MEQTQLIQDIQATEEQLKTLKRRHSKFRDFVAKITAAGITFCFFILLMNLSELFQSRFVFNNQGIHYLAENLQLFFRCCAALLTILAFMFLVRRSRETEIQITNTDLQILHSQQQQQLTRKQNQLNEYFLRKKDFVDSMEKVSERDLKHYPENQDYKLTTLLNYHLVFDFLHPEKHAFDAQRLADLRNMSKETQSILENILTCMYGTFDNNEELITDELLNSFDLENDANTGLFGGEIKIPNSFPSENELLDDSKIANFEQLFSALFDAIDKIGNVAQYSIGHKSDFNTLKGRLPNIFREIHNVRVYFEQSSQEDFENHIIFRVAELIHTIKPQISPRTAVCPDTIQKVIINYMIYTVTSSLRNLWDETIKAKSSNKAHLDVSGPRARPSAK